MPLRRVPKNPFRGRGCRPAGFSMSTRSNPNCESSFSEPGLLGASGTTNTLVTHRTRGVVSVADGAGESVFRLSLPAAGFVVDDTEARREEGADFQGDIPDDAKSGTLHNML